MLKKCVCGGEGGPGGCEEGPRATSRPRRYTQRRGLPVEQLGARDAQLVHQPCPGSSATPSFLETPTWWQRSLIPLLLLPMTEAPSQTVTKPSAARWALGVWTGFSHPPWYGSQRSHILSGRLQLAGPEPPVCSARCRGSVFGWSRHRQSGARIGLIKTNSVRYTSARCHRGSQAPRGRAVLAPEAKFTPLTRAQFGCSQGNGARLSCPLLLAATMLDCELWVSVSIPPTHLFVSGLQISVFAAD